MTRRGAAGRRARRGLTEVACSGSFARIRLLIGALAAFIIPTLLSHLDRPFSFVIRLACTAQGDARSAISERALSEVRVLETRCEKLTIELDETEIHTETAPFQND